MKKLVFVLTLFISVSAWPKESGSTIISKVHAINPVRLLYVKTNPLLAYKITSDRFVDIPVEIRMHLGDVDHATYERDYLRENIGSVIALQVKDGKPDFYVIGKP